MTSLSDQDFLNLLKHHFEYDREEGKLIWKVPTSNRVKVGDLVGTLNPDGYIQVQFHGKIYKLHRLIWFIEKGQWPKYDIDHIDRDRSNNRIVNLRDVIPAENSNNAGIHSDNLYGHKGVAYDPKYAAKPWRVQISRAGKVVHRSHHERFDDACSVSKQIYADLGSPV